MQLGTDVFEKGLEAVVLGEPGGDVLVAVVTGVLEPLLELAQFGQLLLELVQPLLLRQQVQFQVDRRPRRQQRRRLQITHNTFAQSN